MALFPLAVQCQNKKIVIAAIMIFDSQFHLYISTDNFVLQCFDAVVGLCSRPVKIFPKTTHCVSGGTLNLTHSTVLCNTCILIAVTSVTIPA